jgi:hypothetical protein
VLYNEQHMLKLILSIIVLVLVLSFFGISIQSVVNSPTGQENFGYLHMLFAQGWEWIANLVYGTWNWIKAVTPL